LFLAQLLKASSQASSGKTEEEKAEGKEKAAAAIVTLEGGLRECSKGKPFFGGESAGYVDVILGGLLGWVRAIDAMQGVKTFDPSTTPLLAAWAERFGQLEQVEAVMPDVQRLTEYAYAKVMQAAAAAASTN
jgi:glutathione S-transferase